MKQKGFTPILIILSIVLVFGVASGAYYFSKSQTPKPQVQNPVVVSQTPQQTTVPQPTSNSDETTNWKTYTNSIYGYRLKYPPAWTLLAPTPGVSEQTSISEIRKDKNNYQSQNLSISSAINVTKANIDSDYIIGAKSSPKPNIKKMDIGGGEAQIVRTMLNGKYLTHIVIWYKTTFIEVNWHTDNEGDQEIFDQILSTFKFLPE